MRKNVVLFLVLLGSVLVGNNSSAQFRVVGYLPTWSGYPSSINSVDLTKVTHINIAFSNPSNPTSGDLSGAGALTDLATVVTAAHAKNVKVLMSIGGAGAPGTTYTTLITTNLSVFVGKIVQFAVDNNLDGIDVDLEGDVVNGTTMTSAQYETFVTALNVGLHAQSKIMTAALATWFGSYITNTAASKFDFINVMSYDAYGTWTGPGQHSPYSLAVSDFNYWNTTKGVPAAQLTVGVPFYGYYWGTTNTSDTYTYIVSTYPGSENLDKINPTSSTVIYYNGIPTIKQKTVFALNNAGGIMIWQLIGDATGAKSLLSAINEVIQGYPTDVLPTVSITAPAVNTNYTEGDTIKITANALDSDGSILKVEFYAGTFKIGELFSAPYTMNWVGAGPGTYNLTAVATDNVGASTTSSAVSITVTATTTSSPFSGTAINLPGKVEAENFNLGGNNVGYYDLTLANLGGAYRTGSVDIEECLDTGGGYDVGWTDAGEWLEYSVNIATTGKYSFQVRVATANATGTFHIEIDGVNVSNTVTVTSTGDWQKWSTFTVTNISLTQGASKMRIVMNTGGFNLNYINVTLTSPVTAVTEASAFETKNMVYPNPMNQDALVHFSLNESGQTTVILFDEMGREVASLANQYMESGSHELAIPRGNFPKGIYWCKISGAKEVAGVKIIME
ncbi:MAG TPA: glycosyl hydrolase family 18 protein [Cytophagaceae bacterium]|jgi:chitinase|nr:glycosyl hydrolase family 18 protein [Cytophagaceae bacterium]